MPTFICPLYEHTATSHRVPWTDIVPFVLPRISPSSDRFANRPQMQTPVILKTNWLTLNMFMIYLALL